MITPTQEGAMSTESKPSSLPPQTVLYQLGIGHYFSHALFVAAKLGIADLLKDGPRHAADLAAATATHAPSLARVMRLLASVGVFEEQEDGCFALTSLGECLRSGVPGSVRAMVMLFTGQRVQNAWQELEYCVQTGNPVFRKRGVDDPFADPARTPKETATFDAAMADFTTLAAMAVAAAYDFAPLGTIVDVGGGNGALLIGILQAHSHLHGTVFDRPSAIERAEKHVAECGLAARCNTVAGDFFKEVPPGADAYILKHVIHDWNDERAVAILQNCHRAMSANGRLLIVEGVYPRRIDQSLDSRGAAANDVNMLVNTGGRQRSEAEFRSLYDAAGFTLTKIVPTPARLSVIEGRPK
jgi:orsellinic acid C2-O-methyltransferase